MGSTQGGDLSVTGGVGKLSALGGSIAIASGMATDTSLSAVSVSTDNAGTEWVQHKEQHCPFWVV